MTAESGTRLLISAGATSIEVGPDEPFRIGRDPDANLVVSDLRVSRAHASVTFDNGWWFEPISDRCWIDGQAIGRTEIDNDTVVRLGDPTSGPILRMQVIAVPTEQAVVELPPPPLPLLPPPPLPLPLPPPPPPGSEAAEPAPEPPTATEITIGRDDDNDLVVADLLASRHHAVVANSPDGTSTITDLGSANGTFVDGTRVEQATISAGQRIQIGQHAYTYDGTMLHPVEDQPVTGLEADSLVVTIGAAQRILDEVSFSLGRGQLLAVVGPTGSGKTTLLRALTGFRPPDTGNVLVEGVDLYDQFESLRRTIGYVPQDDILHPQLTIRRALGFGAELRFPSEVTASERTARVDEVMEELGLTKRADTPIEKLSGGQRKRTSVALELLTRPSLILLDEPTSGLDPGFEKSVMQLLRELADGGRTVVVVTHSVANLELCDKVLFLAPGGAVAFLGPPKEALGYFARSDYADVFDDLEGQSRDWKKSFASSSHNRKATGARGGGPARRPPPPSVDWASQFSALVRRQLAILGADRRNFGFLIAETLIPAILILSLVGGRALASTQTTANHNARTLIAALAISASAIGAANALREIVKESAIYLRERAAGVNRSAYILAKLVVIGSLTAIQVSALVVIATLRAGGPTHSVLLPAPLLELMFDIVLTSLAAVALGLVISALVSSSEKAMALIAVIFIVQWLFSGVSVDLNKPVIQEVSYLVSANWGTAAAASSVDLRAIEGPVCSPGAGGPNSNTSSSPPTTTGDQTASGTTGGQPTNNGSTVAPPAPPPCDARWHHNAPTWILDLTALVVLTALSALIVAEALARKEPVSTERPSLLLSRFVKHQVAGARATFNPSGQTPRDRPGRGSDTPTRQDPQ